MREIKFRAWRPEVKKMKYDITIPRLMGWGTEAWTYGNAKWMQYTGLKDKNGKEIYEGDILKVDDGEYGGEVKFNEQDLSYVIEDKTGGYGFVNGQIYDEWPEYRTYEVIGNVWEHPHLLEGRESIPKEDTKDGS